MASRRSVEALSTPFEGKPRSGAAGSSRYSMDSVRRNLRYERRGTVARLAIWNFKAHGERCAFDRVSFCGRAMGGAVPIMSDGRKCWPSGVAQCASVHNCPVCCAKIKARRAVEIEALCNSHALAGGRFSMLTATVRHDRSQSLDEVRGAVGSSWRKVQRLKSWTDLRSLVVGQVVAPEVTFGENGWHPHLHVLLFTRPGVSEDALNSALTSFRGDWLRLVNECLGRSPSIARGVHLLHFGADSMAAAAGYLSKVAKELTASDLKSGRDPFTLLDGAREGDAQSIAMWFEYARAMKGVRSVAYSKGLRELYAVDELEDDDIAELDESAGVEVCWVSAEAWNRALRDGAVGELLSELELSLDPLMFSSA
jgi:hypothetical protein